MGDWRKVYGGELYNNFSPDGIVMIQDRIVWSCSTYGGSDNLLQTPKRVGHLRDAD